MTAIHIRMYIEKFYRFVGEIILKPQMIITICQHKAMPISIQKWRQKPCIISCLIIMWFSIIRVAKLFMLPTTSQMTTHTKNVFCHYGDLLHNIYVQYLSIELWWQNMFNNSFWITTKEKLQSKENQFFIAICSIISLINFVGYWVGLCGGYGG